MKSFSKTLKRYIPVLILNAMLFVVWALIMTTADDWGALFCFFLCLLFHGVLSYLLTKKVIVPALILFFSWWILIPLITLDFRFNLLLSIQWLFEPILGTVISFVGTCICKFICFAVRCIKEGMKE